MNVEQVALDELKLYAKNPRKGDVSLIAESLEAYGQYKPITVNKRNGEILAGNHTYQAAQKLGWDSIAVTYVDVDETTAAKIVAIDNRTADQGKYDTELLLSLLDELPDLKGTGYFQEDLDDLLALIDEESTPLINPDTPLNANTRVADNVEMGPTAADYAERYLQKQTRMLMVDYHNSVYVWVIDKLTTYRTQNNLTTNADAIISLLENASGEKAPTNEPE